MHKSSVTYNSVNVSVYANLSCKIAVFACKIVAIDLSCRHLLT